MLHFPIFLFFCRTNDAQSLTGWDFSTDVFLKCFLEKALGTGRAEVQRHDRVLETGKKTHTRFTSRLQTCQVHESWGAIAFRSRVGLKDEAEV